MYQVCNDNKKFQLGMLNEGQTFPKWVKLKKSVQPFGRKSLLIDFILPPSMNLISSLKIECIQHMFYLKILSFRCLKIKNIILGYITVCHLLKNGSFSFYQPIIAVSCFFKFESYIFIQYHISSAKFAIFEWMTTFQTECTFSKNGSNCEIS